MRYMIFDNEGNAVDAFVTRRAALASLRGMVRLDPDAEDELVLVEHDDAGRPTGNTLRASDLTPSFSVEPTTWLFLVETGVAVDPTKRPRSRESNTYVPGWSEQSRVRWADGDLVPTNG